MATTAPRTASTLRRHAGRAVGAALLVIALGVFVLGAAGDPRVKRLQEWALDVSAPITGAVGAPFRGLSGLIADLETFVDVHAHNRKLREDVVALSKWREIALRLEAENARLRSLNKVTLAPRFDYITAQVVGGSGGAFRQSVVINAGRKLGVKPGSLAMDGTSVVGRVIALGDNAARVLLITDSASRLPVTLMPGRIQGILSGDNTPMPKVLFPSRPGSIFVGQRVITSNHGGVLPKGLPIGTLTALTETGATVEASADFEQLEFVRLVIEREDLTIDPNAVLVIGEADPEEAESDAEEAER